MLLLVTVKAKWIKNVADFDFSPYENETPEILLYQYELELSEFFRFRIIFR